MLRSKNKCTLASITNSLPVAHVKCEYIIFSISGFNSTNICKMNSLAGMASLCGPVKYISKHTN